MADLRTLRWDIIPYAEQLVELARQAGWNPIVTSSFRSVRKQRQMYADYLAGRTPYTVAPPGKSTHAERIAFDLSVAPHRKDSPVMLERLRQLGDIWKGIGGTWGGDFNPPDPVHFDAR